MSEAREETTSRRLRRSNSVQLNSSAIVVQSNSQVEEEEKVEEVVLGAGEAEQKMADPAALNAMLATLNSLRPLVGTVKEYRNAEKDGPPSDYLDDYEEYCDANKLTTLEDKLRNIKLYLKDSAKTFIRDLKERADRCEENGDDADEEEKEAKAALSDWKKFRKVFIERFSDPRHDQYAMNEFFDRHQTDKESVQEYADALQKIAARIKKRSMLSEDAKIAHFCAHVKARIKLNLTTSSSLPKTLNGVIQQAVMIENALNKYHADTNERKKSNK